MKSTIALNEMSWHFQTENIWATFYCVKIRCRQAIEQRSTTSSQTLYFIAVRYCFRNLPIEK